MTISHAGRESNRRQFPTRPTSLRLDLLTNPYGPSLRVLEAIASCDDLHLPHGPESDALRQRIANQHAVPVTWVTLGNGIDELIDAAIRTSEGPVVSFPPTDPDHRRIVSLAAKVIVEIPRSHRFAIEVDPAELDVPRNAVALAQSPNDPTGTIMTAQDAVRLSRKCALLLVDERHAAYSPRTLIPLVREFENVVVLRTFETWAGLSGFPIAYAIAPPKVAAALRARRLRTEVAAAAVVAAHATLDDLPYVDATVERVREEKARLFRTLRKLNMIRPHPSWSNFVLARVERGDADTIEAALNRQGIVVYRPVQPELPEHFRISATTADATAALKNGLIEVAAKL